MKDTKAIICMAKSSAIDDEIFHYTSNHQVNNHLSRRDESRQANCKQAAHSVVPAWFSVFRSETDVAKREIIFVNRH